MFTLDQIRAAAETVHRHMLPTAQHRWPLLCRRTGCEVWVKHENHTSIGAFKIRGGLVHLQALKADHPEIAGVIAATRGNHGQSIAVAAAAVGLRATVVVPHGNAAEKNAAMRAQGARLVEHGHDFQAALEHARDLAASEGLYFVESFHPDLVRGVASYALELFTAHPDLDTVYVPIGLGSGICGVMAVRDALGLATRVVGVCSAHAPAYALSFAQGKPVATNSADTMADGMACRVPVADAVAAINAGAERVVTVTDDEVRAAMVALFTDTHNVAEGAGAAALAALLQEREAMAGRKVGIVLSGGNVDRGVYAEVLGGSGYAASAA
jgi:threonine dehydratase